MFFFCFFFLFISSIVPLQYVLFPSIHANIFVFFFSFVCFLNISTILIILNDVYAPDILNHYSIQLFYELYSLMQWNCLSIALNKKFQYDYCFNQTHKIVPIHANLFAVSKRLVLTLYTNFLLWPMTVNLALEHAMAVIEYALVSLVLRRSFVEVTVHQKVMMLMAFAYYPAVNALDHCNHLIRIAAIGYIPSVFSDGAGANYYC